MKAWRLEKLGGRLALEDVPLPEPRPGSVLVKVEATALLSYLKAYVEGKLPRYNPPANPFTIGTNAIGTVEAVGRDVWSLEKGQRVVVSPFFVARENVDDPAQILIGLTAGADQNRCWPTGRTGRSPNMRSRPSRRSTPLDGFEAADAAELAALSRFIVPFGGLLRGRLAAGETLVVNGATGAYGTAAVLLGVAMGAARVIAAGRNREALAAVAKAAGPRVAPVALAGDVAADAKAIREASGGGADIAFDMVGNAADPRSTLAALTSLKRGGRLVLMGSMTVDLPLPYTHHAQQLGDPWPVHVSGERLPAPGRARPQPPPRPRRDPAEGLSADGAARGDGGGGRGGKNGSCRGEALEKALIRRFAPPSPASGRRGTRPSPARARSRERAGLRASRQNVSAMISPTCLWTALRASIEASDSV